MIDLVSNVDSVDKETALKREKNENSTIQLGTNSQSTQTKSFYQNTSSKSFNSDELICIDSAKQTPIFHHFRLIDLEKTSNPLIRMKTGLSPMLNLHLRTFPISKPPKFGSESPNLECDESADQLLISKTPSSSCLALKKQFSSAFGDNNLKFTGESSCSDLEEELKKFDQSIERFDQERDLQKTLLSNEVKNLINPHYIQNSQPNITAMMRAILLDWVMEVAAEFGLKRETYSLASSYVDRYLSKCANVEKSQLQLLGATSLYLAIKAEVIFGC